MRYFIMILAILIVGSGNVYAKKGSSVQVGKASYYHKKFHGRKTANGERFSNNAFTCAHRKLRFNTIVKVTKVKTGRVTFCRVNDRGPFSKGRIIDLSRRAAEDLKMVSAGVSKVKVEVHCRPGKGASKYNAKNAMVHCPESP